MFNVKIALSDGQFRSYIIQCEIQEIMERIKYQDDIELSDIVEIHISKLSSTSAIRQGKR